MSPNNIESGTLDRIIEELGHFGKYNLFNYTLILLPTVLIGIYSSAYIFIAGDIDYRCKVHECEASNSTDWIAWAIPSGAKCSRYGSSFRNDTEELDQDVCSAERFDNKSSIKCDGFVYGFEKTIVSDFDLGCQEWKRTLVGTIHNLGSFLSISVTGILSDRFGRKICFIVSAIMHGVTVLIRSFLNGYEVYIVFEFLETALGGGFYSTAFVLIVESVSPKHRVLMGTLISVAYSAGLAILAGLQWALQDWRTVLRVSSSPVIFILVYFWILDDSVRWLLSKGRFDEAMKIIKKAAKFNNVVISDKLLVELEEAKRKEDVREIKNVNNGTSNHTGIEVEKTMLRDVSRSTVIMKRLLCCIFLWITATFTYYGLSIYSVSLSGNKYLNYILVCLVEIPSHVACIFVIDRIGRRRTMITTYSIGGLCCFIITLIPKDLTVIPLLFYMSGKFALSLAFDCVYVYTSEVFPTPVRQSLLAVCSTVGRIGSLLAPQVPLMGYYVESLPNLLFGSLAVISGVISFILPETTNKKLPDTIQEAENIEKKK